MELIVEKGDVKGYVGKKGSSWSWTVFDDTLCYDKGEERTEAKAKAACQKAVDEISE